MLMIQTCGSRGGSPDAHDARFSEAKMVSLNSLPDAYPDAPQREMSCHGEGETFLRDGGYQKVPRTPTFVLFDIRGRKLTRNKETERGFRISWVTNMLNSREQSSFRATGVLPPVLYTGGLVSPGAQKSSIL